MPIFDSALLALGLGVGLLAFFLFLMKRAGAKSDLGEAWNRGTFTIGPATTFLTGPVTETGHIDYATALNDQLSGGVTAENNANVAIWEVLGPNPPGGGKVPPGFFERMGVTAPPATGNYFVGLSAYCAGHAPSQLSAVAGAVEKLSKRPWTAGEHAVAAGWLRANEKPLAALREGVKRSHYYHPLLPETAEKGLGGAIFPGLVACRELAAALATRATLHVGHGNPAEAWQDLLACHRFARQVAQGATMIEGLIAIVIELLAWRADVAFLDRAGADAETVAGCLRDLLALPPPRPVAEQLDLAERYWYLATIMHYDRFGAEHILVHNTDGRPIRHRLRDKQLRGIDWDQALEIGNEIIDVLTAVFRKKDRGTRTQALRELEAEHLPWYTLFAGGGGAKALKKAGSASARGQVFGEMSVACAFTSYRKFNDAADRSRQTFETLLVAFALTWYQRVNGQYPDSLNQLAPNYLKTVPGDVFSGKELIYRPNASGFLLYSVGVNGIDEGGRWADDHPPGDDIVVRIPQLSKP